MARVTGAHVNADAQKALEQMMTAAERVRRVLLLPTGIGSQVRWSNGVIWERTGGDEWQSLEPVLTLEQARAQGFTAPSAHIASGSPVYLIRDTAAVS